MDGETEKQTTKKQTLRQSTAQYCRVIKDASFEMITNAVSYQLSAAQQMLHHRIKRRPMRLLFMPHHVCSATTLPSPQRNAAYLVMYF